MRRRMVALAGFAVVLSALPACAEQKLLVGIYKSGTQQYFIDEAKGFASAAEAAGYRTKTINVELDANLAVSAVSDAIAAGAKGISLTAPDQAMGAAAAKAAAEAGVLLVATDDPLVDSGGKPIPFVGFDGIDMGTKVGEKAGEMLKASGWLKGGDYGILSVEVQTLSVCNDRTGAAKKKILAAGSAQDKIIPVSYDGTTDSALAASGPVITAHPGIDKWVVFGCNDEGVLGAINALKNAGFDAKNVIAVGLGGYEACRPWRAGLPSGFKASLYISGVDVGKAAANALITAIERKTPLPENTVAKTSIIDPDTYKNVMTCN